MSNQTSVNKNGGDFTRVNNKFFGLLSLLKGSEVKVYLCLMRRVNQGNDTSEVWPSYKTIMEDTGIKNRNIVSDSLKTLEEFGLIIKERKYNESSHYFVSVPSDEEYQKLLVSKVIRHSTRNRTSTKSDTSSSIKSDTTTSTKSDTLTRNIEQESINKKQYIQTEEILESNVEVSIYPEGESITAAPADITLQPVEDLNPIEGVREEIHRYKSNLTADTELQRLFLKDLFWSDSPDNKFSSLESKGAFARLEEQYPDKLRETIEQGGLSALGSEDSKIIRSINNLILDEIYKEESKGERRNG